MWWLQELNLSLMVSVNNIQDDLKKILYLFLFWEVLSVVHSCCQTFDLDWSKFILLATRENLTKQNWTNMNTVSGTVSHRETWEPTLCHHYCLSGNSSPGLAHLPLASQIWWSQSNVCPAVRAMSVVSKLSSRMFVFNHIIKGTRIMFTS